MKVDKADPHALVIGAGIVGLSTAYYLRRYGWRVTLIDKGEPGLGCSAGNAGAISSASVVPLATPGILRQVPRMLVDRTGPLTVPIAYGPRAAAWFARFVAASNPKVVAETARHLQGLLRPTLDYHRQLAGDIGSLDLLKVGGQLHVYPTLESLKKDSFGWDLRQKLGVEVQRVDRKQIEELEPAIGPKYQVGYFLPGQGMVVDPLGLAQALAEAAARDGVKIVRDEVLRIRVTDAKVDGVVGTQDTYQADYVVVCAGAHSAQVLRTIGLRVPLESQRGYHATLLDSGVRLQRVVVAADRKVFVTPMNAGLRVAGTVEFGGLKRGPNTHRAQLLLDHCRNLFPQANVASPSFWMGHRPCLPDSMPVLGMSKKLRGLAFNFGHGHLGLTMAPASADLVARTMSGERGYVDIQPFAFERF